MSYGKIRSSTLYLQVMFLSFFSINFLTINPTYVLSSFVIILSFLFIDLPKIKKTLLFYFIYFFLMTVCFFIGIYNFNINNKNFLSAFLYLFSILLGFSVYVIGDGIEYKRRVNIYQKVYYLLIIFMFIDLFIRFIVAIDKDIWDIYSYKLSYLYWDSNFNGIILLLFLMFHLYLKQNGIFKLSKVNWLFLVLLLILTFSRAAILIFFFFQCFFQLPKKINKFLIPIFIVLGFLLFIFFLSMYLSGYDFIYIDGSFNSKFYLLSLAIENYDLLPTVNKLFGIGMNNFQYISNGIFAHNILITYVYEFGLIGTLITCLFFLYCYKKIGYSFNYILLPYLTIGLSLFSAYSSTFFVLVSCMMIESSRINKL